MGSSVGACVCDSRVCDVVECAEIDAVFGSSDI